MITQDPIWAAEPQQSLDGDITVALDDGTTLLAHSQLLSLASPVFKDAISCHSQPHTASTQNSEVGPASKRRRTALRLPLHCASRRQAVLLLHVLYSWDRAALIAGLRLEEMVDVATIADLLACCQILQMVDTSMVKAMQHEEDRLVDAKLDEGQKAATGAWLSAPNAPARHKLARQLHLASVEDHIAGYLALHAHEIDICKVDAGIAGILRGVCKLRHQLGA